jgi:hypothetical protein
LEPLLDHIGDLPILDRLAQLSGVRVGLRQYR